MITAATFDSTAFVKAIDSMVAELPEVQAGYVAAVAQDGYRALATTTTFENRTYALREAFSQAGDQFERRIFIDPSAGPRRGKTPPAEYGAYLDQGTRWISPRRFMQSARDAVEVSAVGSAEAYFGGWIRRGGV